MSRLDLVAQLSSIKYKITSTGKIQLESKEDAKKRGVPSPDRADAVAMTYYLRGEDLKSYTDRRVRHRDAQADYDEFGG